MEKRRKWMVSRKYLPDIEHDKTAEILKYAGFSGIEVKPDFISGKNEKEISEVRDIYRKNSLIIGMHLPNSADADISCLYETRRKQALDIMLESIRKASLLGVQTAILHPSTNSINSAEEGIDRYLAQMEKSIDKIIPAAEKAGLKIAIENMLPGDNFGRFGSKPEHFTFFDKMFKHPSIGFCLDTGHALVSCGSTGTEKFFRIMGKRIFAFHLHDNSGDRDSHLAPGHGLAEWSSIFKNMSKLSFRDIVCIEAPPFAFGPNNSYSKDAWKSLVEEIDTLAEKSV